MEFKVTLEDFWSDGDGDISEEIKSYIVLETKRMVFARIKDDIKKDLLPMFAEAVQDFMKAESKAIIADLVRNSNVKNPLKGQEGEPEFITIEAYVHYQLLQNRNWHNPADRIEKVAKSYAETLRKKYDLHMASNVVHNMIAQNLLKEDVADLLLSDGKGVQNGPR